MNPRYTRGCLKWGLNSPSGHQNRWDLTFPVSFHRLVGKRIPHSIRDCRRSIVRLFDNGLTFGVSGSQRGRVC